MNRWQKHTISLLRDVIRWTSYDSDIATAQANVIADILNTIKSIDNIDDFMNARKLLLSNGFRLRLLTLKNNSS